MLRYVSHAYVPHMYSYTIHSHVPVICQHTNCDVRCVSPKVVKFVTQFLCIMQLSRLLRYCLYSCPWVKFRVSIRGICADIVHQDAQHGLPWYTLAGTAVNLFVTIASTFVQSYKDCLEYICTETHTYVINDADVERKCIHTTCVRYHWLW